ncbi:hypothetical protein JRQ81_016315 [Phrynocephalus forsythii]|uniref:Secreted protein n=1 Tax=Phrynocephalus forsythii TaxID=171643 RepID=A0A9Q1B299_9SAUR|nr:hypothetical protein JRQ81_016315 [Phrynocephalus forsythii]
MSLAALGAVALLTSIIETHVLPQRVNATEACLKEAPDQPYIHEAQQDTMQTQRVNATEACLKEAPDQPYIHEAQQGKSIVALDKHLQGLHCVQANPPLKDLALKVAAKELKMEEVKTMREALSGTPFAMTKEERLEKAISMIPILIAKIDSIVQASLFLLKGAKVEMAVTIIEKAKQLEDTLMQLEKIYEYLKGRA